MPADLNCGLRLYISLDSFFFFFQAEDGIRDYKVTGVQTCALPISLLIGVHVGFGGWLLDQAAHYPLTFVPLPWLVWAAFRFGPREAATAAVLTSEIGRASCRERV